MIKDPRYIQDYSSANTELIKALTLSISRILGSLADEITIIGGLVPSLIIPQENLKEDEIHPGSNDLDLVLQLALLDQERYKDFSKSLRESGFQPDEKDNGTKRLQQWVYSKDGVKLRVDFLISPTLKESRPGKIHHLEKDFGALVIRGADLAFRDRIEVELTGRNLSNSIDTRKVWVCGPAAFLVLKAFALKGREKPKDAFDIFYLLNRYPGGLKEIFNRMKPIFAEESTQDALQILREKFETLDHTGPMDVARFLGNQDDENLRQDASALVLDFLDLCQKQTSP